MKGLSTWEPWATLLALGVKIHETRGWATPYRGPLLIHAAKHDEVDRILMLPDVKNALATLRKEGRIPAAIVWRPGHVVGVANLAECYPAEKARAADLADLMLGGWGEGRYAWKHERARLLPEPIPWAGKRGLWDVPPDLEEQVQAQLWTHASGLCVCPACGKQYYDHPAGGPAEWQGRKFLTRLCDGSLVKL